MRKSADAYRSIGEVSKLIGVPPHVLRYWETQFPQLAPVKRPDGRRYYRLEDLRLAAGLCEVLREEGMTTRGAARMIAEDKGATLRARGDRRLPERFRAELAAAEPPPAPEPAPPAAQAPPPPRLREAPRPPRRARSAEPLPLFPDLPAAPAPGDWLARLCTTAAAVRRDGPALSRGQARRLHRTLAALLPPR